VSIEIPVDKDEEILLKEFKVPARVFFANDSTP